MSKRHSPTGARPPGGRSGNISSAIPKSGTRPCSWLAAPAIGKLRRVPAGPDWIHEIKHYGYRLIVQREGARVRLFTRNGYDCSHLIVEAALGNRATSFVIDGKAVLLGVDGIPISTNCTRAQGTFRKRRNRTDQGFWNGTFSCLTGYNNLHGPPVHIGSNLTYGLGTAGAVFLCCGIMRVLIRATPAGRRRVGGQ
jgi:hypothetical protein